MDYEEQCQKNRERNRALLQSLGLGGAFSFLPPQAEKKPRAPRKRKASVLGNSSASEEPQKNARIEDTGGVGEDDNTLRRSGRTRGKKIDYAGDNIGRGNLPLVSNAARLKEMQKEPRSGSRRTHDPKTFGAIPGISVGTWWLSRQECSADAVHAPWVAGIAGGPDGAYSVALSGGYEDDVDCGEAFTYTGAGGRDLKGTKNAPKNLRTAPQSCDQSFENRLNKALEKSCQTKNPIRVIRGYKLKSPYAPPEGYRYDGLYTVEKAWMEEGLNPKRWKVCKFAFKRLAGQAPLQLSDCDSKDADREDDQESSGPTEGSLSGSE